MNKQYEGRETMRGIIYRFGVSLKDFGERAGHRRRFYAGALIRIGLAIREMAARA